jgi:hypothetical protein
MYFAALNPAGGICSIGTNNLNYIAFNCNGMIDNRTLKMSDIGLEFISVKGGNKFKTKNR